MVSLNYCMFENTSLEMKQVVNAMEEACSVEELDFSQYELDAFKRLYSLCKRYIRRYDEIEMVE